MPSGNKTSPNYGLSDIWVLKIEDVVLKKKRTISWPYIGQANLESADSLGGIWNAYSGEILNIIVISKFKRTD
jgi:hypothetical protein